MTGEISSSAHLGVLLLQTTGCIAAGLAGSYLLRSRAARAHQVLLTGLLLSVFMPASYLCVGHLKLGLRAARPETPDAAQSLAVQDNAVLDATAGIAWDLLPPNGTVLLAPAPETAGLAPRRWTSSVPWDTVLLFLWLAASAVLLVRLLLRFALGLRLLHHTRRVNAPALHQALRTAQARLGINEPVHLRCSEQVRSPITWCWGRAPVLLVQDEPDSLAGPRDWVGVFCHELAHLKRLDHITGLFAELLTCALPWHPLIGWSTRRLLKLTEDACDDWVLASGHAGVDYAESLLGLSPQSQMAFLPTVVGKEKAMKERIRRIVKDRCGNPRIGTRWALAVSLLALLTTVGVALGQRRPTPAEPMERQERQEMAMAGRREALERKLAQLVDQARDMEAQLRQRGDAMGEDGRALRFELDLQHELIQILETRLRDFDQRGRRRGERPETPAPNERQAMLQEQAQELRRHREELTNVIRQREQELRVLGDTRPEERERLQREANELREQMGQMDKKMANLRRQLALRQRGRQPEAEAISQRLAELREHAGGIQQRLREIDRPDSEQAQEMRMELREIEGQIDAHAKELDTIRRRRPGIAPKEPAPGQPRRRALQFEQRINEMRTDLRQTEIELRQVEEQGRGESDEARELRVRIDRLMGELRAIENERAAIGPARERPGRSGVEAEVDELRANVNGLNAQMERVQAMLRELLERRERDGDRDRPEEETRQEIRTLY